ncbi:MAG: ribose 5-phosphate isomerase B [candidate division WOR-3 bacterium]|nr:ribose 5-phosphate isomerase B [candidate division WOR-3 bacterium]
MDSQRLRRIGIGSDHRGYKLKEKLKEFLKKQKYQVIDFGVYSEERADYPLIAFELTRHIPETADPKLPLIKFGILICGSGIGMSISANKVKGIRAALCLSPQLAMRARQHNNANVLVLPAEFISFSKAKKIVEVFLREKFLKGRYQIRNQQILEYEKQN